MPDATRPEYSAVDWRDRAFDLTRGIAAYTGSRLIAGIARIIARHPEADIGTAFNHKQVGSKIWARDKLFSSFGGDFGRMWILGGWYGVLAAMLFDDSRFRIAAIDSFDIDPICEPIARTLVGPEERFEAWTRDMYGLDYEAGRPDLVINTACEHIADLRGWLDLLPAGTRVLLQSNDYFSEPSHINSMASLADFEAAVKLGDVQFAGELAMKKYTRFMLIGTVTK